MRGGTFRAGWEKLQGARRNALWIHFAMNHCFHVKMKQTAAKKKKQKHKARHVGPDKNNRKDREEQINVSFLQMSFLFPSGMLQATHSNQAYMTQWQLIHPWCRFTATIQRLFMQLQKTG